MTAFANSLPFPFVKGYINTLIDLYQISAVNAIFQKAFEGDIERLTPYDMLLNAEDVGYDTLAKVFESMEFMLTPNPKKDMPTISRRIGLNWWLQSSPIISRYWQHDSLSELLAPDILNLIKVHSNNDISERFFVAIEGLALALTDKAQIDCDVMRKNLDDKRFGVNLTIKNHPFCDHSKMDRCWIFGGIVDGFLSWLYGWQVNRNHESLKHYCMINSSKSTSHNIVFDCSRY